MRITCLVTDMFQHISKQYICQIMFLGHWTLWVVTYRPKSNIGDGCLPWIYELVFVGEYIRSDVVFNTIFEVLAL